MKSLQSSPRFTLLSTSFFSSARISSTDALARPAARPPWPSGGTSCAEEPLGKGSFCKRVNGLHQTDNSGVMVANHGVQRRLAKILGSPEGASYSLKPASGIAQPLHPFSGPVSMDEVSIELIARRADCSTLRTLRF